MFEFCICAILSVMTYGIVLGFKYVGDAIKGKKE